jgi:hypothetical protein
MLEPTLVERLNQLAGALALDLEFRKLFMQDRVAAIDYYNRELSQRSAQSPLELGAAELKLISALKADSVEEFIGLLAIITTAQTKPTNFRYRAGSLTLPPGAI